MNTTTTRSPFDQLSDREWLVQLHDAVKDERRATAHLIALLVEVDSRRLYLGEGFSSLFTYCTQALHLSEHAAYNRIETARAARRLPVVLDLVAEGAITLTAVRLLAPHLTPENYRDVLERARHKSKRDVELLVATLHVGPDVPAAVRKLPARVNVPACGPFVDVARTPVVDAQPEMNVAPHSVSFTPESPRLTVITQTRSAEVKPLAPERYKIQFTVGRETYDKLGRAQDLLRHVVPNGDPAVIFDRALALLVAELERRKIGATSRPRTSRAAKVSSRHVPAKVRRTVCNAMKAVVHSSAPLDDAARPGFSSITTWCHSLQVVKLPSRISSSGAARTIITRPGVTSVLR